MKNRTGRVLGRLWRDKATIKGHELKKVGSVTKSVLVTVAEAVPCKVSLKLPRAAEKGLSAQIDYEAKLYLAADLNVPDGAEISVTDVNGRVTEYVGARPFVYASHQEILLSYRDKVR